MNNDQLKTMFTDREWNEIQLALLYVSGYNHGTSGHLAYNVIAKLFTLLIDQQETDHEIYR